jgi:crossover junction endodeoxyribonuclease RusA
VITIEVRGLPAPQGSKWHVGGGRMIESSKAVGPWREAVRAETQRVLDGTHSAGLDGGPLAVELTFRLPRPRGHYGTGRNKGRLKASAPAFPAGRPDLDKLTRAVLDGLTAGGVWADDAQVVNLGAWKLYGPPGVLIQIEQVEGVR